MRQPWSEAGPGLDVVSPAFLDDVAACRALLREGSKTFFAASLLLPPGVRGAATALYAFCRQADDAVDRDGGSFAAVRRLRARLDAVYAGRPERTPADRALAVVVRHFAVPRELPDALLEGIGWDAEGRRYADLAELQAYAARVAGAVGAMMTLLMGVRSPEAVARATDLGVAMQLSNIARDVGEDARAGRLYLPQDWLREAGIDPDAWLASPRWSPALGAVVGRLLDEADRLYARAEGGIALLPVACRPGIFAARLLYAAIGHRVARNGGDSVSARAVVPTSTKLLLLARAYAEALTLRATPFARPPLAANSFLVAAVEATPGSRRLPGWRTAVVAAPQPDTSSAKVTRVLELFLALEQREQLRSPPR